MDLTNANALFFASLNTMQYFAKWNTVLMIIVLCSIISIAVFVERLVCLRKAGVNTSKFLINLRKIVKNKNIVEAIRFCEESGGCVANIIKSGLMKYDRSKEQIESAMDVTGSFEIARLEKNTKILSIIAHIAPLLGLLGTVLGFIEAFSEMRQTGLMDISTTKIGEAMEYALLTTAAGLTVAIPTVVAYNYIVNRIESFVLDMQTTSSEIVDILVNNQEVS